MSTVYTTGVFDLLHPGHIYVLKKAASYGDRLVVGVQSDDSVLAQKGNAPTMSADERVALLKSLSFVHDCIVYDSVDQRPMLDELKPQLMVQTEEWIGQTDRTPIIEHLKQNDIRLVLLPINKTISSTQIKERVISGAAMARNDVGLLTKSLQILAIDEISVYEQFDPKRTAVLKEKIEKEGQFTNPIVVGKFEDVHILLDGANRLQALRELGATSVFVHVLDYTNPAHVELRNNAHFLDMGKEQILQHLENNGVTTEVMPESDALAAVSQGAVAAVCKTEDTFFALTKDGADAVDTVNAVAESYIGKTNVYRLSELSQDKHGFPTKIYYRTFGIEHIVRLAKEGRMLGSGITWHRVKNSIVRFAVPLHLLTENKPVEEKQAWLEQEIEKKIASKDIRYHASNVYLCDEWS